MRPGIILLDGADFSGKTTLAEHMKRTHGARILHNTRRRRIDLYFDATLLLAFRWMDAGHLVVIDRHWPSEIIYGVTYRGASALPEGRAEELDRRLRDRLAATVLCVPSDMRRQSRDHAERAAQGKEMYAADRKIQAIFQGYADLAYGNEYAILGGSYVERLSRGGGMAIRRDVAIYDWHRQGADLAAVSRRIFQKMG